MKRLLAATALTAMCAGAAAAQDEPVKIGVLFGFTGPIESLTGPMAAAAEAAMQEVSDSGALLGGRTVDSVRADTGCIDNPLATSNAERLITAEGIDALIGAACSGATSAVLQNVAIPNGMVMISPSATSPGLSTVEDQDLFFRTAPSDARQSEVMANILRERGIDEVALTYTNNDYGKALADSFGQAFEAAGGTVTISAAHEDNKADYSAEVGSLASAGGDLLLVAGYVDTGGSGIVRSALDTGAFDRFHFPDGMISDALIENFGTALEGSTGQIAGAGGQTAEAMGTIGEEHGFDATSAYAPESYDAAAILMLAMQAADSTDPADYGPRIMEVANAPGEKIQAGELARALRILSEGGDVDYVGGTDVELIGPGESAGTYREIEVQNGAFETVRFR